MILDQMAAETADPYPQTGRQVWWLPALDQSDRPPGRWPAPSAGRSPRIARLVLRTEHCSPKAARDFTERTLADWRLAAPTEDVTVVVSELVTNAVRYGQIGLSHAAHGAPVQLVLFGHPRRLVAVVTDPSDEIPQPLDTDSEGSLENGRGLLVVQALSNAWSWAPLTNGGKAVWAAFELVPAEQRTGS